MQPGRADAHAVGTADFLAIKRIHPVRTHQEAHTEADAVFDPRVPFGGDRVGGQTRHDIFRRQRAGQQRGEIGDHAVAASGMQHDFAARVGDGGEAGGACPFRQRRQQAGAEIRLIAIGGEIPSVVEHRLVPGATGAVVVQHVAVDEAGLAVGVAAGGGFIEHGNGLGGERGIATGFAHELPEFAIHHDGVVCGPQPAFALGADKAEYARVAPGFGGHAGGAAGAANLHFHREEMIHQQCLFPGLQWQRIAVADARRGDDIVAQVGEGADQRNRAGGRAALHAADRCAGAAHGGEVQQHDDITTALERQALDQFQRLAPTLATVVDAVMQGAGWHVCHIEFRPVGGEIRMARVQMQQNIGRVGPINHNQFVIIRPTDAAAVQQQIEFGEAGDGGGAVGEQFHVAAGLLGVAMLQMPSRRDQRAAGDGVAKAGAFLQLSRGQGALQQRHVAGGDAIGHLAEAFSIFRSKYGAACHGDAHAGVQKLRRRLRFAEAGAGVSDRTRAEIHQPRHLRTIHSHHPHHQAVAQCDSPQSIYSGRR